MASRIFLDANILLDFTLKRDGYEKIREIFKEILAGHVSGYISPSIVHIVGYWLTKAYGSKKAKELLLSLLSSVKVIEVDHDVVIHALHSKIDDIEDALQYFTAIHHKLDAFITEDKHMQKSATRALPVYSTDTFLRLL